MKYILSPIAVIVFVCFVSNNAYSIEIIFKSGEPSIEENGSCAVYEFNEHNIKMKGTCKVGNMSKQSVAFNWDNIESIKYKYITANVGNVRLTSTASKLKKKLYLKDVKRRIRERIKEINPDIITLQEVWDKKQVIDDLLPAKMYDVYCSDTETQPIQNATQWEHECMAIKRALFEYAEKYQLEEPTGSSNCHDDVSTTQANIGLRKDSFEGVDAHLTVFNVHTDSPVIDIDLSCRLHRIVTLISTMKYISTSVNTQNSILIMGDFNYDFVGKDFCAKSLMIPAFIESISKSSGKKKDIMEEVNRTCVYISNIWNHNVGYGNKGKLFHYLSIKNENEYKVTAPITQDMIDYVISNNLQGDCQILNSRDSKSDLFRLDGGNGMDHYAILCNAEIFPIDKYYTITKHDNIQNTSTIVVVDRSGSMQRNDKMFAVKKAAGDLLTLISRENDMGGLNEVGLVSFNESATIDAERTDDVEGLKSLLDQMVANGSTNMGDALEKSMSLLENVDGLKTIILLSDGHIEVTYPTRDDVLVGPNNYIDRANNENIKICTVGFSDPSTPGDIDEDLLKRLAEGTGCEYYYGKELWDLMNNYISIRHSSTGDILATFNEKIQQGETKKLGDFNVSQGLGELYGTLNWPGSNVDLELKDPSGRTVDEKYPGAIIWKEGPPKSFIIKNPKAGKWSVTITGTEIPAEGEPVKFVASVRKGSFIAASGGGFGGVERNKNIVIIALVILGFAIGAAVIVLIVVVRKGNETPVPQVSTAYCLVVDKGGEKKTLPLTIPVTTLGRDGDNSIVLKDDAVSRHHARVLWNGKAFIIEDMGSSNGTFVNEQRITKSSLAENSEIRIGKITFILKMVQ